MRLLEVLAAVSVCVVPATLLVTIILDALRRRGVMGINTRSVACPTCLTGLPIIRFPMSLRQVLFGGWTCNQCGTETDMWGRTQW
jgi:hypothetical protein